ncbi:MAG: hypothetical protein JWM25_706 [Thermoleophilia bacterium]|nr:hypothetical protein [Thermoleophilia bacterium]MCZ4496123.1 hypothetical protein [Thermoleophilia bacterium]
MHAVVMHDGVTVLELALLGIGGYIGYRFWRAYDQRRERERAEAEVLDVNRHSSWYDDGTPS